MLVKRVLNQRNSSRWLMLAFVGILTLMAGTALAADTDIVITEVMNNPAHLGDSEGEWFEVYNGGATPVDLNGWIVSDDGTDSFVIGASAIVPAGGYAVLGLNAVVMAGEGVTLVYEYSGMFLGNSGDELVLTNVSLVEINRIEWDGGPVWPDLTGESMMWDEATADNNVGANWSASTAVFGTGDKGTPGIANGGGFSSLAMIGVGDAYSAVIPAGVLGDAVDYYVSATDNDAQTTTNPGDAPVSFYTYNVAAEVITPIATVHADSAGFDGTLITVQGQVYISGDFKADGVSVSAYIQDASGRGLNIFGTTRSTGMSLLNDTSAIVKVTGYVDYYFATLEIVNYEVELVSTGNAELVPTTLSTLDAAALTNEGTNIKSTGPITAILTTGGSNSAHNFTVDDGSGPVVIRIDDDVVVGMDGWLVGDELVASGAGGSFSGAGQIIVGLANSINLMALATRAVLRSLQRPKVPGLSDLGSELAGIALTVILLLDGRGLYAVALGLALRGILNTVGNVAGCYVSEGEVRRGAKARLVRDSVVIYTGKIRSRRRVKDDVKDVLADARKSANQIGATLPADLLMKKASEKDRRNYAIVELVQAADAAHEATQSAMRSAQ